MATPSTLSVIVSRVDGTLFLGEAVSLTVPSVLGEMMVLPHHEPLIALLGKGTVTVQKDASQHEEFTITSGLIEISNNRVTVLV